MRVGVDLAILQQPMAGSSRWAVGLFEALKLRPSLELRTWTGMRRMRRGGVLRKVFNLARERAYYDLALPRAASRWGADVLLMPVNLSARRGWLPQLVTILDVNFLSEPGTYDRFYARYAARMFARAARDAEVLSTISDYSRREIARHLSVPVSRINVVYPGLNQPSQVKGSAPIREPYALYVGATEPHKDVPLLVEAWAARRPPADLRLVIVGKPGRAHERVRRMAEHLNDRVVLRGPVEDDELERWYLGARVFLFPSRTEGFGFPPLEAMQRRIPVIAARAGALPEVLGDAALFHEPGDAADLRRQVEHICQDHESYEALVAAGLERTTHFRWDRTAATMESLLRRAAGVSR